MALVVKGDGDLVVANLAERDALLRKINTMQVTVLDASADPRITTGAAMYQWSSALGIWRLLWVEEFSTELLHSRLTDVEEAISVLNNSGSIQDFEDMLEG